MHENSKIRTRREHVLYRNCLWHSEQFLYTTCSPHVLQKEELWQRFTCIYILPSIQMGLQTFEIFFMALKVVLQDCNGFSNNQRKGTTKEVFSAYMWSKLKSFKWCIWTIKSISSYIWIILSRHLNGQNWFLKVHSLWKNPLTECLIPSQQPKSICTHFFKLSGWPDNFLGSETYKNQVHKMDLILFQVNKPTHFFQNKNSGWRLTWWFSHRIFPNLSK